MNGGHWLFGCKRVARVVLIDTAVAFVPPLLLLSFHERMPPARFWETLLFSFVYSQCIGAIAFATVPKVWMRTLHRPPWLRWVARIGTLLVATLTGELVAGVVFVGLGWISLRQYWPEFNGSLEIAIVMTLLGGGTLSMYESFTDRLKESALQLRTKELERVQALKLATEAQLASLESRIHPHFLFNTLNSISSLIPEDPEQAERLIEQMAALLRFSLDSNHAGLVPLGREMKIVTDYLEIERARFGDRLRYHIDLPSGLDDTQVPPLSIQTLVENSVKHAISGQRAGGEIRIGAARDNGLLRLEVLDQGPEFMLENAPTGHGIDILKRRMAALFGAEGGLLLERRDARNRLTLSVPQANGKHASIPG
jgi:branched-subunit amino acid transport protein